MPSSGSASAPRYTVFHRNLTTILLFPRYRYEHPEGSGNYVKSHWKISKKYLKGWFFIDFVSIFPFDTMGMVMKSDAMSSMKIFRIIRLLRLLKLARMFKTSRILKRMQSKITLLFATQSLMYEESRRDPFPLQRSATPCGVSLGLVG